MARRVKVAHLFRDFQGGADFCPLYAMCRRVETNCRDRLVVRTLRCGRSNPGSNPGHGRHEQTFCLVFWVDLFCDAQVLSREQGCKGYKNNASAGNRTRINCLEGSYADHYTTDAVLIVLLPKSQVFLANITCPLSMGTSFHMQQSWGYSSVVEQSAAVR